MEEISYKIQDIESMFEHFNEIGRRQDNGPSIALKSKNFNVKQYTEEMMVKIKSSNRDKKKHKSLDRKIHNIESDINKISSWRQIKSKLDSNSIDLESVDEIEVGNKTYKLDVFDNKYKKIDFLYNKVKRLAQVEKQLMNRREASALEKENLTILSRDRFDLDLVSTIKPVWVDPKKVTNKKNTKADGFDTFLLNQNIAGAIGKTASGNDHLRNIFASKNDVWFHLDGHTGSHLILKIKRDLLNEQILRTVGSMLISYSGLSVAEANLIYTEVKNIKGIKKQKGSVTFKKAKYLKIFNDPDWKNHVLL